MLVASQRRPNGINVLAMFVLTIDRQVITRRNASEKMKVIHFTNFAKVAGALGVMRQRRD